MQYNSTVAKLLAKENITIRHGNYKTAWFDVEKRVLGLPMWKDMGKDVYDLLIGHEVGHALETPLEGWHESLTTLKGCPKSYLNVIEDARIERKVQSRYPGLVGSFTRGYKALSETGFFGDLESYNWNKMDLIDKINIQAKLRGLVDVKFTPTELEFYNRALTTDTWEDVVQLTLDVVAYTNSFEDEKENPAQIEEPTSNGDNGNDIEQEEETNSSEKEQEDNEDSLEESTNSNIVEEDDADDEVEKEVKTGTPDPTEVDSHADVKVSITDEIYRGSEDSLIELDEQNSQRIIAQDISKESLKIAVVPYAKVRASREKNREGYSVIDRNDEYRPYIKEIKKSVYFAVKEFEMRKAAYQYSRASTSDSGRIDVNKLWSYKTNDDIFSQVTQLANSKNHGMIMLVDYSGSMVNTIPHVIDQLLHLALFCRQVHIPFDVYGFTGGNRISDNVAYDYADGDLDLQDLRMPLLCSSSLNKKDFNESLYALFEYRRAIAQGYGYTFASSDYERFGHTPLDPALLVTHHLIKEFKAKHKVQKMNLVVLSDGESNRNYVYNDKNMNDTKVNTLDRSGGIDLIVDKKVVTIKGMTGTQELLKNIRTRYGVNTIGFFIANNNADFRNVGYNIIRSRTKGYDDNFHSNISELKSKMAKEYRANRCVSIKDCMGYNEYYVLKGGSDMSTDIEEFDIGVGETKNKLATAFKKFSHSKKQSKVLMTKFGKAVA